MSALADKLTEIVGNVFEAAELPQDLGLVRVSDRPDLAQFQCNGAMAAAKIAKKSPRDVAADLIARLEADPQAQSAFSRIEIAGPGFLNFHVHDAYLCAHLKEIAGDETLGVERTGQDKTVILDYGGSNIAKPMHVGHLRSAIIGDTMRRVMAEAGFKTLGDVHMGDWGTHLGILFSDYLRHDEADWIFKLDLSNPDAVQELFDDLSERYPQASATAKADPDLMAEAQATTLKMQRREDPYYAMWKIIRDVSIIGMKANYGLLNVHFDLWKGEADVHDLIPPMVEKMKDQGYAIPDEGALIVPVKRNDDTKEVPPLIMYKRDGGVMYGTTDLATLVERMSLYAPDRIIYVVDQRQHLHFEQVFRAARLAGIVPDDVELIHAGFGTMNGPDGKPFKTRAGGVMRLGDLIEMARDKARQRLEDAHLARDLFEKEREEIAHMIAVAAIKFADLQNQRQSDYIFDLDRLTQFEGKTGPYHLYQAVRIKSLLRKAAREEFVSSDIAPDALTDVDRSLALLLADYPSYFAASLKHYAPHHLCEYAFKLAQEFSSFYGVCHILSEKDATLRGSRLRLCEMTLRTLERILGLCGLDVPERM